jgi:hypothetical protein
MSKSEKSSQQPEALSRHSQSLSLIPLDVQRRFIDGSVLFDPRNGRGQRSDVRDQRSDGQWEPTNWRGSDLRLSA